MRPSEQRRRSALDILYGSQINNATKIEAKNQV